MSTSTIEPTAAISSVFFPLLGQPITANDTSNTTAAFASLLANNTSSLLTDLTQSSSQDATLFGIADLVNLSPQAQSYLNWLNMSDVNSASSIVGGNGFILTAQQQSQISAIIAKYKDALFNIGTYNNIMKDLAAAGLSPDQLAAQDATSSMNLTQMLLDALNGQSSSADFLNFFNNPTEQANTNSYKLQIINQWESVSTQFNVAANSNTPLVG